MQRRHEGEGVHLRSETPQLAPRSKHSKQVEPPSSGAALSTLAPDDATALVAITKQIASDQKALAGFDKRIETEKQLVDIYGKWIDVVAARQRTLVNHVLRGVLIILVIAIVAIYATFTVSLSTNAAGFCAACGCLSSA